MPLAALFSLEWYGPCCAATYMDGAGTMEGTMKADSRMTVTMSASGDMSISDTVGVDGSVTMAGSGDMSGTMKSDARMGVKMNIGDFPSAFEVAQETWALSIQAFSGNSAGGKLNAAGGASDPLTNDLNGYGPGTAGEKLKKLPLLGAIIATVGD